MPFIPGSRGAGCPDLWQDTRYCLMRTKEAWEELVTYCPAAKQSEVTVQHRSGLPGLVMEEDGGHTPPSIPAA